jgi:hypothetical protein
MVEKYKKLLAEIEALKGEVDLFVIAQMDDLSDKWSIIISASWVKKETETQDFSSIVDLVKRNFTKEETSAIAVLSLYDTNDYVPQLFLKYNSGQEIRNEEVNGFKIQEAYILKSLSERLVAIS